MLLEIENLHAGYGDLDVLRGVDLAVDAGELVAVLGPNGAGKSTLLRTISRYDTTLRAGVIRFNGHDLTRVTTERTVRLGCLHVPEGRQLFTEQTVDDNLRLGAFATGRRNCGSSRRAECVPHIAPREPRLRPRARRRCARRHRFRTCSRPSRYRSLSRFRRDERRHRETLNTRCAIR